MSEQHRPFRITPVTNQGKSVSMLFKNTLIRNNGFNYDYFSFVGLLILVVWIECFMDWLPPGSARLHRFFSWAHLFFYLPKATLVTWRQANRYRKWTLEIKASKPILALDECLMKVFMELKNNRCNLKAFPQPRGYDTSYKFYISCNIIKSIPFLAGYIWKSYVYDFNVISIS